MRLRDGNPDVEAGRHRTPDVRSAVCRAAAPRRALQILWPLRSSGVAVGIAASCHVSCLVADARLAVAPRGGALRRGRSGELPEVRTRDAEFLCRACARARIPWRHTGRVDVDGRRRCRRQPHLDHVRIADPRGNVRARMCHRIARCRTRRRCRAWHRQQCGVLVDRWMARRDVCVLRRPQRMGVASPGPARHRSAGCRRGARQRGSTPDQNHVAQLSRAGHHLFARSPTARQPACSTGWNRCRHPRRSYGTLFHQLRNRDWRPVLCHQ